MRRTNSLPVRVKGTRDNPYAEIDGHTVVAQLGSDTMHISDGEDVYPRPVCGMGFARNAVLVPFIGFERSRPVCRRCRKIVGGRTNE